MTETQRFIDAIAPEDWRKATSNISVALTLSDWEADVPEDLLEDILCATAGAVAPLALAYGRERERESLRNAIEAELADLPDLSLDEYGPMLASRRKGFQAGFVEVLDLLAAAIASPDCVDEKEAGQ